MTCSYLLGIEDFPARWHCGRWTDWLGWIHISSDLLIWAAYFAIPIILLYFKGKRTDLPFSYIFPVFGAFILACGTNHLVEVVIFWYPIYRVSAMIKVFTALISWIAVIVLFDLVPKLLSYPSPEQLRQEVAARTAAQNELERKSRLLQQSNQALQAFSYTASHDLKTPLRGIRNLSDFLVEDFGADLPEGARERVAQIKEQANRMERLLNGLLDYSTTDFSQDEDVEVDTAQMVQEIADLTPRPPGIAILTATSMPVLKTRVAPLATVLRNLISNAVLHHHKAEGTIEVGSEDQGEMMLFWVKDDGPGIEPAHHQRIFEVFKKLSKAGSSGVGLSLVRKTVEEAGGSVTVESEPGQGCKFSFSWPKRQLS